MGHLACPCQVPPIGHMISRRPQRLQQGPAPWRSSILRPFVAVRLIWVLRKLCHIERGAIRKKCDYNLVSTVSEFAPTLRVVPHSRGELACRRYSCHHTPYVLRPALCDTVFALHKIGGRYVIYRQWSRQQLGKDVAVHARMKYIEFQVKRYI